MPWKTCCITVSRLLAKAGFIDIRQHGIGRLNNSGVLTNTLSARRSNRLSTAKIVCFEAENLVRGSRLCDHGSTLGELLGQLVGGSAHHGIGLDIRCCFADGMQHSRMISAAEVLADLMHAQRC